ncbi:olfactory receptor class A-like protein 4 [Amia ocellicauda]|uniref:olfactory receptor class A-like protein 4 n=1 Tax=Amia ocellicauda TaxID=2972642 RepID=UPI003463BB67
MPEGVLQDASKPVAGTLVRVASPLQNTLYCLLVMLGIVGNGGVGGVVGVWLLQGSGAVRLSDAVLLNMVLSNLMVSLFRNILLMLSDLGLELYLSWGWCKVLMCVWVWLRCANVWATLCLSAFHLSTLRRLAPSPGPPGPRSLRGPFRRLLLGLALMWALTLVFSLPVLMYSTRGQNNQTEDLMLISSTTRPLLGCVWSFPSRNSGLAYATVSMVLHEATPILLMLGTNLGTLHILAQHGQAQSSLAHRVPAEKRAAKVVLVLVMLFLASWGGSVLSVNFYNYNRGPASAYLLVMARFTNSLFIAGSPLVLLAGHRRLRHALARVLAHRHTLTRALTHTLGHRRAH